MVTVVYILREHCCVVGMLNLSHDDLEFSFLVALGS